MNSIPVLMYHAIDDQLKFEKICDQGEYIYVVAKDNFREQMKYLKDHGFTSFFYHELVLLDDWPKKAIIITFDDGHESNYTIALPILQEFGFKAEFFVTSDWISKKQFLNPNQINNLFQSGMAIGSHGITHRFLDELKEDEIEKELSESQNILSKITNTHISIFSAPGGRLHPLTISIAKKKKYKEIFTSQPGVLLKDQSSFCIPRFAIMRNTSLDKFIKIVNKDSKLLLIIKFKNYFFLFWKKFLGNKRYEAVRKILLDIAAKFK